MVDEGVKGSVILFGSRDHLRVHGDDRRLQGDPSGVKQQQAPPVHGRSDASYPIHHVFLETTSQVHEPKCHVTLRSLLGAYNEPTA
jgi:hypothetical protein